MGREYSAEELLFRIEVLGDEAPDYYRDVLAALEGSLRRLELGTGLAGGK
jgi:hypothetical protein